MREIIKMEMKRKLEKVTVKTREPLWSFVCLFGWFLNVLVNN